MKKPKYIKLKPSETTVDQRYQRELDPRRAKVMSDKFDPALLGVPVISKREDGDHVRIDGQHRLAAAEMAGRGDESILCEVHEGLTITEEAALFLALNGGRSAVRVYDKFKARQVAKEPVALEIVATLKSIGLRISKSQQKGCVCAIQAVESAFHRGNLLPTLKVLKTWSGTDPAAFETQIIKGVSWFLHAYPDVDLDEVAKKLSAYAPTKVTAFMKRKQGEFECSARDGACHALREIYNERRKHHRLPPLGRTHLAEVA